MPFDRLPSHNIRHFEYHIVVPPPRPVVNWGPSIVDAIDKMANAVQYLSPAERSKRQLQMAQVKQGLELLPQQGALQKAKIGQELRLLPLQEELTRANIQKIKNANAPPGSGFESYDAGHWNAVKQLQPQSQPTMQSQVQPWSPDLRPKARSGLQFDLSRATLNPGEENAY